MPVPEPVAFTIGGLDIMWYAIFVTGGIVCGCLVMYLRAPKHELDGEKLITMACISVPVGIIGARLYYVIFNWDLYAGDFLRIINTRGGGLAIHGGLIFGLAMTCVLCLAWKIRPLNLLDLIAPGIALAQSIGRWGNYFNSEAHGGPTDLPWAVTVNGATYHPTFFYESIWCMLLFLFLLWLDNRRGFEGQVILAYGILYSLERFFVEALRTDSLMIGPFKQAQVLSLVIIACCVVLYVILSKKAKAADNKRS